MGIVDSGAEDALDVLDDLDVFVCGGEFDVGFVFDTDELTFAGLDGVDEGVGGWADLHIGFGLCYFEDKVATG